MSAQKRKTARNPRGANAEDNVTNRAAQGHPRALQQTAVPILPAEGLVRLHTVLALVPVGESTWWAGVRSGRFPRPVAIGLKTRAWRASDIRKLLEGLPEANAAGLSLPVKARRAAALQA